jgi:cellulose synthase/poly-beta-1,6-N-acetylglucosamine synthase-like glycosyltransferase
VHGKMQPISDANMAVCKKNKKIIATAALRYFLEIFQSLVSTIMDSYCISTDELKRALERTENQSTLNSF